MPCDSIRTAQMKLGAVNADVMAQTMERLGIAKGSYALRGDNLILSGAASSLEVATVKQEISKTIVLSQAKRFGFSVKETKDGKLQVMKKAF